MTTTETHRRYTTTHKLAADDPFRVALVEHLTCEEPSSTTTSVSFTTGPVAVSRALLDDIDLPAVAYVFAARITQAIARHAYRLVGVEGVTIGRRDATEWGDDAAEMVEVVVRATVEPIG